MTPAVCLVLPASPTTTITGRLPPSGQVRKDKGFQEVDERIQCCGTYTVKTE